jgi:hypothetical protein
MAVLLIIVFSKIINDQPKKNKSRIIHNKDNESPPPNKPDDSNLTVKEGVYESSNQSVEGDVKNIEENKIEVLEKAVDLLDNVRKKREPITINDIPEKKNRGFSVEVPNPEKINKHQISRVGSDKEGLAERVNKVFFKKNDRR